MSSTWLTEQTITDAEAVARERLARYALEHDERFAMYALTWGRRWAQQRAAAAMGRPSALWRVK